MNEFHPNPLRLPSQMRNAGHWFPVFPPTKPQDWTDPYDALLEPGEDPTYEWDRETPTQYETAGRLEGFLIGMILLSPYTDREPSKSPIASDPYSTVDSDPLMQYKFRLFGAEHDVVNIYVSWEKVHPASELGVELQRLGFHPDSDNEQCLVYT